MGDDMAFQVKEAFQHIVWPEDNQPLRVAELALWSALSDGEVEEHELVKIVETIQQIPKLESFSKEEAAAILLRMSDDFDDEDRMIARIQDLTHKINDDNLRKLAYQLAVYCAASDGMFTEAESNFLEGLREAFELSSADAKQLIDEVIAK
jgi:tellurite resistance protein